MKSTKKTKKEYWIHNVKTVSTYPPPKIFTRKARTIANAMSRPDVSPKGLKSGMYMIIYHLNRGGVNLKPEQKAELKKAIKIMQNKIKKEKKKELTNV